MPVPVAKGRQARGGGSVRFGLGRRRGKEGRPRPADVCSVLLDYYALCYLLYQENRSSSPSWGDGCQQSTERGPM